MGAILNLLQKTALVAADAFITGYANKKAQDYSLALLEKQYEMVSKMPQGPTPIQQAHMVAVRQPQAPAAAVATRPGDEEWENYPNPYLGEKAPVNIELPTTEETIVELKQRLSDELYRFELDLQKGLRIAGKPCDCAKAKHTGAIRATAEELMSYEVNPLYGEISSWISSHLPEFSISEIAQHEPGYYQAMAPEIRNFRKQL